MIIKFIIRLAIILMGLFLSIGFLSGVGADSFLIACIFLCSWIIIVPFERSFWWLFAFASLFSILNYDNFGVYVAGLLIVSIIFDIILKQLKKMNNNSYIILYGISFLLAVFFENIIELLLFKELFLNIHIFIINIVITCISFFIFNFLIGKMEKFVSLYTHGDDMKYHT